MVRVYFLFQPLFNINLSDYYYDAKSIAKIKLQNFMDIIIIIIKKSRWNLYEKGKTYYIVFVIHSDEEMVLILYRQWNLLKHFTCGF